ncbi:MAG: GNAT family N-acetyltransferase [Chloroflexota bacterium]
MTFAIREATEADEDLETVVRIVNQTTPDDPDSIENLRWSNATYPGTSRFIAEVEGVPIGVATVGRMYVHPPEFEAFWATATVLPGARHRGVGTALLIAISDRARDRGKHVLHLPASDARPEGIAFLLHRGFSEYERSKTVSLELDGATPPDVNVPDGIVLTTLAERPDLADGVYGVAVEAFADIPGGDTPIATGDPAEFRAREIDRPGIPHEGFIVAQSVDTGRVVGYASLIRIAGAPRPTAWHDMTAVARDHRGRGIAGALKRATIRWAIADGIEVLEAGNDTDNAAMRAVNARAGYRPLPDSLTMRGPLFKGIMSA